MFVPELQALEAWSNQSTCGVATDGYELGQNADRPRFPIFLSRDPQYWGLTEQWKVKQTIAVFSI